MQGKTHRVGGVLCALAGYSILESKGMLISDVSPLLQLTVMYPFAIYGSIFSDLDHNPHSIPSKDIVSVGVNRILHITSKLNKDNKSDNILIQIFDADHRSWQTHSDLFLIICIALSVGLIGGGIDSANDIILKLVATGFILGVISHLILDLLTPEGIWFMFGTVISSLSEHKINPKKIHLVPKSSFFATGGQWEKMVRITMWIVSFILFGRIIYFLLPYRFLLSF
jgi:membrane-bound metal-dependent hydrolase YbcI (DUF457 family)